MLISENKDRLNSIIKIYYSETSEVSMMDYPGEYASCVGSFTMLRFSAAEFVESDAQNGAPVSQELTIEVRGQSQESDREATEMCGKYLILQLQYSNGKIKVVGTPENPVVLSCDTSGTPVVTKLLSSRLSAEKAKYLLS